MPTDDERRRVAEMLRELDIVTDIAGWKWIRGNLFGLNIMAKTEDAVRSGLNRLADLIEPVRDMLYVTYSRSTCGPDGRAYMVKVRHRDKGWERDFYAVDREALLRLSEGLEKDADRIMDAARGAKIAGQGPRMEAAKRDAYEWRSIARQIRRACGEENE